MSNNNFINNFNINQNNNQDHINLEQKNSLSANSAAIIGLNWAIKVERVAEDGSTTLKQPKNYDLLLTSMGIRCMTRTADMVKDYEGCGEDNYENW